MAKSSNSRSGYNLQSYKAEGPGVDVEAVVLWRPPLGINRVAAAPYVPPQYCRMMENYMFDRGKLRSRFGTEAIGSTGSGFVMAVFSFTTPSGNSVVLRVRTNGIDRLSADTSGWTQIYNGLTGGQTDYITWTGWGDAVLITNGVDKIVSYNVITGAHEILEESPPARHITSFGNRVIASAITKGSLRGNVVAWSAKNDDTDWTAETTTDGLGAGFEDLLGSPEGHVDQVMGVFPITDEVALMVREFSVWVMSLTGDFNAPFRFSRVTPKIGARGRRTIANTPYGVVFASRNDVMLATTSGVESIGETVRDAMFPFSTRFDSLVGAYDPKRQEYRLADGVQVWRYSFLDKGWSRDVYRYPILNMSFVSYDALELTWDELNGTWDQQVQTWDDLVIQTSDEAMYFVISNLVIRERGEVRGSDDEILPIPIGDLGQNIPASIETATMRAGTHLDRTMVVELQLEYECLRDQILTIEFSDTDGIGWEPYGTFPLVATSGVALLRVRKTLDRRNISFRLSCQELGWLIIHSLTPMIVKGGRINW